MSKIIWKPGTVLYPVPAVMVSLGDCEENFNIITIAWTGIINSVPPMTYISVRPTRHSYSILKSTGEFVINLTNEQLTFATDFCGVRSGKNMNKFKEMNLTMEKASVVKCPLIKESPVNIECVVKDIIPLGSHHMFMAEIVSVSVDEKYKDEKDRFCFEKSNPIAYSHGEYYSLGKKLGKFGYSVAKKK